MAITNGHARAESGLQEEIGDLEKQQHGIGNGESGDKKRRLAPGEWVETHMNWSWFTLTQSTGGIAIALSECPKQFDGLQTIGKVVFIFNLVCFVLFASLMIARWVINTRRLRECFTSQPECFFFGSFWLSIATIIICMQRFAVPSTGYWMIVTIRILFWTYAAVTLLSTTIHMVVISKHTPITMIEINPGSFLLIYNAMLTGTVASSIAMSQPPHQRMPIMVAGVAFQGLGWMGAFLFFTWFLGHILQQGWPEPSKRPGLFMPVGGAGFTIVALVGLARSAPEDYGYFAAHPTAKEVLTIVSLWIGIFIWVFALWLFGLAMFVSLAEIVKREKGRWIMPMQFDNTWYAMIFPNVGFALATVYIGQGLESNAILWVATAMIIALVAFWLFDLVFMIKSIAVSFFRDRRVKLM